MRMRAAWSCEYHVSSSAGRSHPAARVTPVASNETVGKVEQTVSAAERRIELTVDELAQRAGVAVRTIREYQTIGVLPAPDRRGRVGIYGSSHVTRLALIDRLQQRGITDEASVPDALRTFLENDQA